MHEIGNGYAKTKRGNMIFKTLRNGNVYKYIHIYTYICIYEWLTYEYNYFLLFSLSNSINQQITILCEVHENETSNS